MEQPVAPRIWRQAALGLEMRQVAGEGGQIGSCYQARVGAAVGAVAAQRLRQRPERAKRRLHDPGGLDRADTFGGPGLGRLLQPLLADQAEAQQTRDVAEDPQVPVVLGCLAGGCGQRQGHLVDGEGQEPVGLRARCDLVHRQLAHRGDLLGAEDVHRGLDVCGPGPPPDPGGALQAVEHLEAHALGQAGEHRDPAVTVDRALPGAPAAERGSRGQASTVPFLVVLFAQGRPGPPREAGAGGHQASPEARPGGGRGEFLVAGHVLIRALAPLGHRVLARCAQAVGADRPLVPRGAADPAQGGAAAVPDPVGHRLAEGPEVGSRLCLLP